MEMQYLAIMATRCRATCISPSQGPGLAVDLFQSTSTSTKCDDEDVGLVEEFSAGSSMLHWNSP